MITEELFDEIINGSSYVTYQFLGDARLSTIFYHFFRTLPGNLYCKDKSGRYFLVSDYLLRSHGFANPTDVMGKTDSDLFRPEEADQLKSNDMSVMKNDKKIVFEEEVTLFDGKKRYYEVIKTPLKNMSGDIIGIIGNSVEVTKRHRIETELRQSKQFMSKFIQNMEHDIRTPLSGLEHTISVLLDKEEDAFKKQVLEYSLSAVEEFKVIINAILNCDHKRYTQLLLIEPFKLKRIFHSLFALYYPTADAKGLKLHYEIDPKIPSVVISDSWRIKHTLLNLLGNSLKFTNKGEVFFKAELISKKGRNLLVEFIVQDTGIGIPKDKCQIVFEKFVRLEDANKGTYKGTGLGLFNVKEYVEQLGGEFKPIQSEPGKSTTVAILIPMKASLDQHMELPAEHKESKEEEIKFFYDPKTRHKKPELIQLDKSEFKQTKKVTKKEQKTTPASMQRSAVLLVEDSLVAQHMAKTAIVGLHCDVDIAGSAEDALKLIEKKHYDLIFADIGLPGMDGIEMTRHIRYEERKKGATPTPIVGQSANANTSNKKACIEAGMQDLLPKPLSTKVVAEVLKNYTTQGAQLATKPVATPTIQNEHVIDWEIFNTIWKDKANAADVFSQAKTETFKTIEEFKQAHQNKNWKQLVFLAHKMRGAFVYFGTSRLEEAFSHLEDYLNDTKEPDQTVVRFLYDIVIQELDSALKEINKL